MGMHKWVCGCNEENYTHENEVHKEKCVVHKVNAS